MDNRENILERLREWFGDCSRQGFLKKMRDKFSGTTPKTVSGEELPQAKPESLSPRREDIPKIETAAIHEPDDAHIKVIDISSTDAWRNHVEHLKDISGLRKCLSEFRLTLRRTSMQPMEQSIKRSLAEIANYVEKKFKEPVDITDDTSEEVANKTGAFVKECIFDLLRGCHNGFKHSQGRDREFYEKFESCLEEYLAEAGVYRKAILPGADVRSNAKWLKDLVYREAEHESQIGMIDEIEAAPHFIVYRGENGGREECIIKGTGIAFREAKKEGGE